MHGYDYSDFSESYPTDVLNTQPKISIKTVQIVSRKSVKKNEQRSSIEMNII